MSENIKKASLFFAVTLLLSMGCYENQDGCQDIRATNFEAGADFPCEDCCTYPDVNIVVRHKVDTLNLSSSLQIYNGAGDTFKIIQAALLVNNFQFQQASSALTVFNTSTFTFDQSGTLEEQLLRDDFVGISSSNNNFNVGNHQGEDEVSAVSFDFGLSTAQSNLTPFGLPDTHPLDSSGGFWQETTGYSAGFLDVLYDTMTMDTVRYRLPAEIMYSFQQDTLFSLEYGANIDLDVFIDYFAWTAGINFMEIGGNEAQVVEAIVNNLPNAISLTE